KALSQSQATRFTSTISQKKGPEQSTGSTQTAKQATQPEKPRKGKTLAEIDEEMRLAMEGLAGDGGEAGLELEEGQAVSMKRGVRENMFRYI
ncbi:uncharacterized protein A1O9_08240, partial [Exophiala aquamarina CBS 119918]